MPVSRVMIFTGQHTRQYLHCISSHLPISPLHFLTPTNITIAYLHTYQYIQYISSHHEHIKKFIIFDQALSLSYVSSSRNILLNVLWIWGHDFDVKDICIIDLWKDKGKFGQRKE